MAAEVKGIAEKAYQLGKENEMAYHGCGQCTLAALQDTLDLRDDAVFKAITGFGGGVGAAGDSGCGAYLGSVVMISSIVGRTRDNIRDPEGIRWRTHELVRKLHDRFIQEYGCVNCRDIQTKLYGRPYYIADPQEFEKAKRAGAHDVICPDVVGKAARWTVEILAEAGVLPATSSPCPH